ncbi:MAG: ribonuclease R [Firmicutes bacterium]|nr:ribonuclease R [Bacillota bacterium]
MIEEQAILEYMLESAYRPLRREELEATFAIEASAQAEFHALLEKMEEEALIVRTRTQRYGVPERMDLVAGRLQVKARGFGFVVPLKEGETDLYISASDLSGAMDGDRVLVRPKKTFGGSRREGEIVRVVKRARANLVGLLTTHGGFGFVQPDDKHLNQDIFVPGEALHGAVDGQKVVLNITEYPGQDGHTSAAGEVVEILGFPNDPGVDILAIVRKFGLAEEFAREVLDAAERIPHEVDPEEVARRRDLRGEVIVTIDGADAKDLDDAVHVRKLDNGNTLLGVHIADVSYYVREGSPLDKEAYDRATSVYLVDRVIPMLPPRLSNGICSLNPRVDRLTLTCEMEWSPSLDLVRHEIYPSVIRTTERMTYDDVRAILMHTDAAVRERYESLVPLFEELERLAMKLRKRRMARGAIDFDFAETKILVNPEGTPLAIDRRERSIAEMIIEECMLAANETVAEHFFWLELPFLYRVHEAPSTEKMQSLSEFVHHLGYHVKAAGGEVHPRALQGLLEKVKGRKEETVISHLMLRSMRQARYSAESLGHFGLATDYYSHFTSPIRRYPDLMIHRIIRDHFSGTLTEQRLAHLSAIMAEVAGHCSERERNAVDAERETDLVKKIEFMQDKVGEEFDGMISGVTGFGLFVELDMLVEGLIHVSYLEDDYYHFHENIYALIGERTKRTYRIGDRVRVRVHKANKETLAIDFALVEKLDVDDADILEQAGIAVKESRGGWGKGRGEGRGESAGRSSAGSRVTRRKNETSASAAKGSSRAGFGKTVVRDVRHDDRREVKVTGSKGLGGSRKAQEAHRTKGRSLDPDQSLLTQDPLHESRSDGETSGKKRRRRKARVVVEGEGMEMFQGLGERPETAVGQSRSIREKDSETAEVGILAIGETAQRTAFVGEAADAESGVGGDVRGDGEVKRKRRKRSRSKGRAKAQLEGLPESGESSAASGDALKVNDRGRSVHVDEGVEADVSDKPKAGKRRRRKKNGLGAGGEGARAIVDESALVQNSRPGVNARGEVAPTVAAAVSAAPASRSAPSVDDRRDGKRRERSESGPTRQTSARPNPSDDSREKPAEEPAKRSFLVAKGGYAQGVAEKFETPRERKRRERDALREMAQSYGVPIKDKGQRPKRRP